MKSLSRWDGLITYKRRERFPSVSKELQVRQNFGKRKRDVAWEHGEVVDGNRFHWKCKWCGHSRRSGGAYRLKKHLAGGYEVASCPKVPSYVADAMRRLLTLRQRKRDKKCAKHKLTENVDLDYQHAGIDMGEECGLSDHDGNEKRARHKLTDNLNLDYHHAGADMGEECGLSDHDEIHTPTAPEQSRVEQWDGEQMAMKELHGTILCNGAYARLNHHWKNVLEQILQSPDMCGDGGIRNCIQKALEFGPLEFTGNLSIHAAQTKDNFKDHGELEGDAERPNTWSAAKRCKEVVLDRSHEYPNYQTDACLNTKKCQDILFSLLISDKFASLCDSLCGNFRNSEAYSIIDFSLINSRMKHGVYERSTGLFDQDIQQVWKKIQKSGEEMALLSSSLSIFSRTSYKSLVGEDSVHVVGESNYEGTNQVGPEEKDSMDSHTTTQCPSHESSHSTKHDHTEVSCLNTQEGTRHQKCYARNRLNSSRAPERVNKIRHETVMGNGSNGSSVSSMELSQPSRTAISRLCKHCGTCEEEGKRFLVCGNVRCLYKYYHIRCLKSTQLASRQRRRRCSWYCPSCLCRACLSDRDDDKIVLCDGCDEAYHIYCMKPALATIPEGTWYCSLCDMARARRGMRRYEQWALQQHRKENAVSESGADMFIDILLSAAEKLSSEEKLAAAKIYK